MEMSRGDKVFLASCIVILIILISVSICCVFNPRIVPWYPYGKETFEYTNITAEEADLLIANDNITILDVRALEGCGSCQFKNGHLPGAILESDPTKYYNASYDILVYSVDGTVGAEFCEDLMYKVYGKVYNLEGGWNDWILWS